MDRNSLKKVMVVLITIITITINALANILPLNGQNTGEISDRFKVLFVPAGYVFSIWGVIYIGMIAYAIFQALPSQRNNQRLHSAAWWFVLAGVANSTWIFLWHFNFFELTLLAMGTLLVSLIVIYLKLGIGRVSVPVVERWATFIPTSIYLGWVSVATIANVTDVLYDLGWTGGGIDPQIWVAILLGVALVIGALMAFRHSDAAYLLVFVWAFTGIANKQVDYPLVVTSANLAAGLAGLLALIALIKSLKPVSRAGSQAA
jgi:hypothetical protein